MNAAEDVAEHIHNSLFDLRRRVDKEVAIEVARAVMRGAARALSDLFNEDNGEPMSPRADLDPPELRRLDKH